MDEKEPATTYGRRGSHGMRGVNAKQRGEDDSWWNLLFDGIGPRWRGHHSFDFGGPDNPFNFGFGWSFGRPKDWWEGPNVCYREDVDNSTQSSNASIITHHFKTATQVCEESETAYRCKSTIKGTNGQITKVELYECCHDYSRQPGQFGCPEKLQLVDLNATARNLGLNDLLTAISAAGLEEELARGNFTLFAPVDGAFPLPQGPGLTLQADQAVAAALRVSDSTLSQIERELQAVLLGHLLSKPRKASSFSDEEVLTTGSPVDSTIRINFYSSPEKLTTANCVRVTSTDNMATNGVIHTVEAVLPTVTSSLMDVIQREADFSTLKTALASANLVSTLKADGQWTLFAPTNAAFKAMDKKFLDRLLSGDQACLQKVLRHHLLPNVICSAVIKGRVKSRNVLDNYLNLTRTDDGKLFVDDAQVVRTDVMAANGVMHVIDAVLVPDNALDMIKMAKKAELTEFVKLVQAAGITSTFQTLSNVTIFVPSNEAVKALSEDAVKMLTSDPIKLERVLSYHVIQKELNSRELLSGMELDTLSAGAQVRVNEYHSFPFRYDRVLTVQCANVVTRNMPVCNGIVHVIDRVLIPPTGNMVDVLAADSNYSTMVRLVKIAGLADALQAPGPFTVFAPTNKAFSKLGKEMMMELEGDQERLAQILKRHIIQGTLCCGGIFENTWWHQQQVRALGGASLLLARDRYGLPYVNDVSISHCDNMADNGVVHGITGVLLPRPDPWYLFK